MNEKLASPTSKKRNLLDDAERLAEAGWPMSAVRVRDAADEIEQLKQDLLAAKENELLIQRAAIRANMESDRLLAAIETVLAEDPGVAHHEQAAHWEWAQKYLAAAVSEVSSAPETGAHLGWREEELKCLLQYHDFHGRQMPDPAGAAHRYRADQLRGISNLSRGCHRSHPHENMDAECELLTEIAREQNASAQKAKAE